MKKFNIGVLGIGDISDVYIENIKKYDILNVLACAGRDIEKARIKAKKHDIPRPYKDSIDLLKDSDIDIILNLTVPAVHAELNIASLQAGKHVYSEKPLSATLVDGGKILALAQEKNLYVGCAPDTFMGSRLQTCRRIIDEGRIGDVLAASAFVVSHGHEWFHPNPEYFYKQGGGPLLDIGPYYITALLALLGPVKYCCGMSTRPFEKRIIECGPKQGQMLDVEVDTHVIGNLKFANGAIATIITSFDVWDSQLPRIEIYGTKGTICIPDIDPLDGPNLFGGPVYLRTRENYRWKDMPRKAPFCEWEEVAYFHQFNEVSHHKNSRGIGLVEMAYAIRDRRSARASGEMAYHSLEVMDALLQSAVNRKYINVESTFMRPEPLPENFPEQ